jgi:hypothetical protein
MVRKHELTPSFAYQKANIKFVATQLEASLVITSISWHDGCEIVMTKCAYGIV